MRVFVALPCLLFTAPVLAGPAMPSVGFVPNVGQAPAHVAFVARASGGEVWVTHDGALSWARAASPGPVLVTQRWPGARAPRGGELGAARVGFVGRGVRAEGLQSFVTVALGAVGRGVEAEVRLREGRAETLYHVAPGADLEGLAVELVGGLAVEHGPDGGLVVATEAGPLVIAAPRAWQAAGPVEVRYRLEGRSYGFEVSGWDRAAPLSIDPLLDATYVGGAGDEHMVQFLLPTATEHPFRGQPYVVGRTRSFDVTGVEALVKAHDDVLVARLSSDLEAVEAALIIGGEADDTVTVAAFSPVDHMLYVAGNTESTALWPSEVTPPQPENAGYTDGFVAAIPADLSTVSVGTYMGGQGLDRLSAIAFNDVAGDPARGVVYVAGNTNSDDLPGREKGAITARAGILDAFVARYRQGLSVLDVSSYIGGASGSESYVSVATDPDDGVVYLLGVTNSWMGDFPVTANAVQPNYGGVGSGSTDLFLARFSPNLTTLYTATYLGGDDLEEPCDAPVILHPGAEDAYVAATSMSSDFPSVVHGVRAGRDALVVRLDRDLTQIYNAVSVGGSAAEVLYDAKVSREARGDVVLLGLTGSEDLPAVAGSPQTTYAGGGGDLFVARLSPGLQDVRRITYLGATGREGGARFVLDEAADEIVVGGYTDSSGWALMQGGAIEQLRFGQDAFAVRLVGDLSEVLGATYYGGLGDEGLGGLAQHPDTREVYLAGGTDSARLPGADETGPNGWLGGDEIYVARFDANLTGAGPDAPDLALTPTSCEFPSAPLEGMTDHRCIFEVKNVGALPLAVQSITSTPARTFPIEALPAGDCRPPVSLEPDGSCVVVVRYFATALGRQVGALEITSNDPDQPVTRATVEGRGVERLPDAGVASDAGAAPDAAAPAEDAGVTPTDAGAGSPGDGDGGCSCGAGAAEDGAPFALIVLAFLGYARRRRG